MDLLPSGVMQAFTMILKSGDHNAKYDYAIPEYISSEYDCIFVVIVKYM